MRPRGLCRSAVIAVLSLSSVRAHGLEVAGSLGRWTIGGYAEGQAVVRTDSETPRQRPSGVLDLVLDGVLHKRVRTHLEASTTFGGTPVNPEGLGFINPRDVFQNVSPSVAIEEGYLDLLLPRLDVRLGQQKFTWGSLDVRPPTDVLNPRSFLDPFLTPDLQAKVGVPAVRASYFPPALAPPWPAEPSITAIWIPVPVSPRFPLTEERWFPTEVVPPGFSRLPKGTFQSPIPGVEIPPIEIRSELTVENRRPPWRLKEGAVGLRVAGRVGDVDCALAYYDGAETTPAFDLTTTVFSPSARRSPDLNVDDLRHLQAKGVLLPRSGRIRLIGADVAFRLGDVSLRAEAAYGKDRLLPRVGSDLFTTDNVVRAISGRAVPIGLRLVQGRTVPIDLGPLTVVRDTVEWGVGLDYSLRGWTLLGQVSQTFVLDNKVDLLINDVDTRFVLGIWKRFLGERLTAALLVLQGLEPGYSTAVPSITYSINENLRIRAGFLLIAGSRRTFVGEFHDNDEGFFQLRYSL